MQVQVAERERAEKALEYQAFHDALSGLPNRALFTTRLERALEHAASGHSTIAVLFLDLDNFKFINDTLGHAAGDELLVIVAERLRACVRPGDTVARLGGDEFTILLEGSVTEDTAEDIARRASESLQQPVRLGGQDVVANVTIGIALDDGSRSPGDLLRAADVALYAGKASGKGRYVTHNSDMDSDAMRLHWAA
jgi:diguanylate cyclase (GGDEF)-like protein